MNRVLKAMVAYLTWCLLGLAGYAEDWIQIRPVDGCGVAVMVSPIDAWRALRSLAHQTETYYEQRLVPIERMELGVQYAVAASGVPDVNAVIVEEERTNELSLIGGIAKKAREHPVAATLGVIGAGTALYLIGDNNEWWNKDSNQEPDHGSGSPSPGTATASTDDGGSVTIYQITVITGDGSPVTVWVTSPVTETP